MSMSTRTSLLKGGIALAAALAATVATGRLSPGPGESAARRAACRRARARPDLDHADHRQHPRHAGLRHAVRQRRRHATPAADGRQVRHHRGQARLHLHAARQAQVPRRLARHQQGRDRLARALGQEGRRRPAAVLVRRQARGGRRQDLPHDAEASPTAWCWSRSARPTPRSPSSCARRMRPPTRSSRSRRRSAPAPSSSPRTSGCRAARRSTSRTPTMRRGPAARRRESFAGSKFPGVDRIELVWISDPQTAMSALINGEIDFYENPNIDFYPILEKAKGVKLMHTGKLDSTHGMIRLNHLHPPFNNVKARQAMYYLINQEDFLRAIVGDPKYYTRLPRPHHLRLAARQRRRQPLVQGVQPEEGAAAAEGGRLQRRADHHAGGDRPQHHHAGDPGADPGHARGRHQRRRPVDGLGLGGLAPRQEGAAGAGRLEHLRHHHGRRRLGQPGAAHLDRRGLRQGPVRLAVRCRDREAAERLRLRPEGRRRRQGSPATCRRAPWSRSSTSRSANGTRLLAYRADRLEGIVPNTGLVVLWNITKK